MYSYKIRRKSDGKFSDGQVDRRQWIYPSWSRLGMSWRSIEGLKGHLTTLKGLIRDFPYNDHDHEVVAFRQQFEIEPALLTFDSYGGRAYSPIACDPS